MQRRQRPIPIAIPERQQSSSYTLTNSGVFKQGDLLISKAGCVITTSDAPGGIPAGAAASSPRSSGTNLDRDTSSSAQQDADIALEDLQDLGVIGSGSSGIVKRVQHKRSGATYVLKVINFDVGNDLLRKQITMELKTLYGAQHPHIVQYHQSYFANGAITILMEHMDGGSLYDLLLKVKKLPEQAIAEVARQVLTGLAHLHKQLRVVHRDIKPSNLLLNSGGQLKLTDFGVSGQLSNSMSKCLSWVGTVTYMSPERIRGDTYSYNTDVWSLGLLLLECATGRFPYPPQSEQEASGAAGGGGAGLGFWELLEYIVVEPAPRLPGDQQFSLEFSDFISQCLQKDAAHRPSSVQLLQHPFLKKHRRVPLADVLRSTGGGPNGAGTGTGHKKQVPAAAAAAGAAKQPVQLTATPPLSLSAAAAAAATSGRQLSQGTVMQVRRKV